MTLRFSYPLYSNEDRESTGGHLVQLLLLVLNFNWTSLRPAHWLTRLKMKFGEDVLCEIQRVLYIKLGNNGRTTKHFSQTFE